MQKIVNLLNVLFLGSCSVVPDLSESGIFAMAANDAVNLKSLERKFMYGMFDLWVDKEEDPFTGWAKSTHMQDHLKELGYLKNGRKEGLWMSWDENGTKISEIYWNEDRMNGPYCLALEWKDKSNWSYQGWGSEWQMDRVLCLRTNRLPVA